MTAINCTISRNINDLDSSKPLDELSPTKISKLTCNSNEKAENKLVVRLSGLES